MNSKEAVRQNQCYKNKKHYCCTLSSPWRLCVGVHRAFGAKQNLVREVNHLVPYALGATPVAYGKKLFKSI